MSGKGKHYVNLQEMSFTEKLAYLSQLPEHRNAHGSDQKRFIDIGTRRPWGQESMTLLRDELAAGSTPIQIAFLARRNYQDVLAKIRVQPERS